jgi:Holliday junction resolvase RusA-like endonuclease
MRAVIARTRVHEFQVYGIPAPQGSKKLVTPKGRRPQLVDANQVSLRSWRSEVVACAQAGWEGPPMDGPLQLTARFVFPRPKSLRKGVVLKDTKPDLDKLVRSVMDALTSARLIRDDARVADLRTRKVWADADGAVSIGATIRVREL